MADIEILDEYTQALYDDLSSTNFNDRFDAMEELIDNTDVDVVATLAQKELKNGVGDFWAVFCEYYEACVTAEKKEAEEAAEFRRFSMEATNRLIDKLHVSKDANGIRPQLKKQTNTLSLIGPSFAADGNQRRKSDAAIGFLSRLVSDPQNLSLNLFENSMVKETYYKIPIWNILAKDRRFERVLANAITNGFITSKDLLGDYPLLTVAADTGANGVLFAALKKGLITPEVAKATYFYSDTTMFHGAAKNGLMLFLFNSIAKGLITPEIAMKQGDTNQTIWHIAAEQRLYPVLKLALQKGLITYSISKTQDSANKTIWHSLIENQDPNRFQEVNEILELAIKSEIISPEIAELDFKHPRSLTDKDGYVSNEDIYSDSNLKLGNKCISYDDKIMTINEAVDKVCKQNGYTDNKRTK